jgi:hypothetical protein
MVENGVGLREITSYAKGMSKHRTINGRAPDSWARSGCGRGLGGQKCPSRLASELVFEDLSVAHDMSGRDSK